VTARASSIELINYLEIHMVQTGYRHPYPPMYIAGAFFRTASRAFKYP